MTDFDLTSPPVVLVGPLLHFADQRHVWPHVVPPFYHGSVSTVTLYRMTVVAHTTRQLGFTVGFGSCFISYTTALNVVNMEIGILHNTYIPTCFKPALVASRELDESEGVL